MPHARFRIGDRLKQALAQAKAENVPICEIIIEPNRVRLIVGDPTVVDEAEQAEANMDASMRAQNGSRAN
jgi:hypothetical protein